MPLNIPKEITGGLDGSNFIKMKDGDKVYMVLRGDVTGYRQHWVGQETSRCPGKATCAICHSGKKPSFRFRVNVIVKEQDGLYKPKILENGWKLLEQIHNLNDALTENGQDLEKKLVQVSRKGSTQNDTAYTMVVVTDLNPDQQKLFASIPMYNLESLDEQLQAGEQEKQMGTDHGPTLPKREADQWQEDIAF